MASDEAWQGGDWMARLPSHLAALPLTRLALPGSHDSGADESLSTAYPVANDETAGLRRLGRWKIVRRLIRRWAITQKRNIAEQLELGVRYLDLRLSFPDKGGPRDLRLVHALYGTPLLECLEQVRVFLDEHPKEVVILDFNHMFDVDEEVYGRVRHLILETLGAARVCEDRSPAETSLEWMWSRRVQAVILSCAEDPAGFWPQSRICSPYADTNDISRLLDFLGRHIVYRRFDRFYVLQGVTTATHGDILLHLWATLDTYLSERTTEAIKHFIDAFPWPWLFNIVMCDQVDADFCRRVVQLNYRVLEREISSKSL